MEADQILRKAWEAVEKASLPDSMQEAAFREAVAILRGTSAESAGATSASLASTAVAKTRKKSSASAKKPAPAESDREIPDEATFFAELARESGAPEADLRDILSLGRDGSVHVTPPTRTLGTNRAEQARTVTALVAAARAIGLKETPVDANAVRREVQRKNCFDSSNYGAVVGRLRGFNYGGSSAQIVTTSRWHEDFAAAVARAHGRLSDSGE